MAQSGMRGLCALALVTWFVGCGDETSSSADTTSTAGGAGSTTGGAGGEGGGAMGGSGGTQDSGGQGGTPNLSGCLISAHGFTAGLPADPVCPDPTCTSDVSCSNVIVVSAGSDLQSAAVAAVPGDCVAPEAGNYGDVALPDGVSLLGRGAADVSVGDVAASGTDVLIRGLSVAGGVVVTGGNVALDRLRIHDNDGAGMIAVDANVTVVDSCIDGHADTGLHTRCDGDCGCPAMYTTDVVRTVISNNATVGLWLDGAQATLDAVMVIDTVPMNFTFGYGIYAADCADITGQQVWSSENASVGVLLHNAGASAWGPELFIEDNRFGVVACAVPASVGLSVSGFNISNNDGVGVALGGGSSGASLDNGSIASTTLMTIPTPMGGVAMVGDGIAWTQDAALDVQSSVQISDSGRAPAVIDASSNGNFAATLSGGDETIGVFLQSGAAPQIAGGIMITQANPPLALPPLCP